MALLALTVLGLALRLFRLGAQPFWNDEVITRHVSEAAWDEILVYFLHDSSPPLYYLFLKAWLHLADSERAIRLLPLAFGVLSIPLAHVVFRRLGGRGAGLLAAGVLAVHPYHLYYSQENRYVTLLAFLGLACAWAYLRFLDRGRWRDLAVLVLLSAAMLYTHYYAVFFLAALWLHCALCRPRTADAILRLLAGVSATFLLVVPWLGVFLLQLARGQPAREHFGPLQEIFITGVFFLFGGSEWTLPQIPFSFLAPDQKGYVGTAVLLLLPAALLVAFGFAADLRRGTSGRGVGATLLAVPVLCVLVVSQRVPLFRPKYLVMVLPFALGLAAVGAARLWSSGNRLRRALAGFLVGYSLVLLAASTVRVYTNPLYWREDWRGAAAYLEATEEPGDVLLLYNPYSASAWRYYYRGRTPVRWIVSPFTRPVPPEPVAIRRRLDELGRRFRRIWVLDYQAVVHDPDRVVLAAMGERFFPIPYLDDRRDSRFALRAFATSRDELRRWFTDQVDFSTGRFLPEQLGDGWLGEAGTSRWMGREASVFLRRRPGQELVQVAFFVHLPYFGDRPVTATLLVEGEPVMRRRIARSDNVALTAVIPGDLLDREVLRVGLAFDRAFVPDEIRHDGDREPKTALVYGFSMLYLGYTVR